MNGDAWLQQRLGSHIGLSHQIVRHLASGGLSHVFLAEHLRDGSSAAVKLNDPRCDLPRGLLRYEATVLARVEHPHIVRWLDAGTTPEGEEYLLLAYVHGVDLYEWLRARPKHVGSQRLLHVLTQLAAAVDHLHARNVVHGDIKPANVMLDVNAGDHVTLVDFGSAHDLADRSRRFSGSGTPGYMAPEQAAGEPGSPAGDRFSFAAVARELWNVCAPLPLLDTCSDVFARGLSPKPAQRFDTAAAFVAAVCEHSARMARPLQ